MYSLMRTLAMLLAAGLFATPVLAADLDCARVTVIVPYPAGGAADVAGRLVADRLEAQLKKSFVVENRPGATGNIGTTAVVNAKPDGCTLLVNDPALKERFANIGYDPTAISPEQAAAIMRRTAEAWAPLIKRLNIKLD